MRTLISFLRTYKFFVGIAVSMMLIELLIEVFQPFMMSKVIDDGIVAGNMNAMIMWGGILLGTTLLAFIIGIIGSFYSAHVSQNFGYDIRQSLYERVQKMSFHTFSHFQEASLMTRMTNDVTQVQNAVFMGMRIMLRAPLLVIGCMLMAFIINPSLAIYLLIAFPILAVFLAWVMLRNNKLFRLVQEKLDHVNRVMQQSLMSIRLIRVFVRMDHENNRFEQQNTQLRDRTIATLRLAELTMPIVIILVNGCILLVIWVAREQINAGKLVTVGDIVAIVNYALRISGALSMISMIVTNISRAAASMNRIDEVFQVAKNDNVRSDENDEHKEPIQKLAGHINFSSVNFSYPQSELKTLQDITFEVDEGEMLAIMGSTGSGKSSLLQLIPRMYEVNEGIITVDHQLITDYSFHQLRSNIGYVPQEVLLFTGTVTENIRWGKRDATMDEVIDAARMAQIHETIMKLPQGYDTLIGQKGVNLSGGQKQRMSIARALVRKPQILLLDDCTSALDVETENKLLAAIRQLSCTVLLVTQKMSSTAMADRILIIDDGRVIAEGQHDELLMRSSLYQRIYQSQSVDRRDDSCPSISSAQLISGR
ncbi:MAG: ABC transporter ATP-binding protein/permease [Candidatus Pristimantibacillus lignocellulolyticus]|uniref:ABC transporter ATP-binding protein/permease n=1 Tax=Candidatus Pristimantibacillus lignocellulolyticus TaxID=2994561 RepID=A0A9J6ZEU3_9BACL|nr:MAG: ABC transporter ATP-binding protein/permease [Candidatus Pristimantibacillus lignocellulolyticus]